MKPCGVILTYIKWSDWKELPFNIALFLFQLMFMIVGTAYGKIKWPRPRLTIRVLCIAAIVFSVICMVNVGIASNWYLFSFHVVALFYFICEYRGPDWRRVWRAVQCSHVRLVLGSATDVPPTIPPMKRMRIASSDHAVMNFGWPKAEIQFWDTDWNDGKYLEYREPTFDPSPQFIVAMIEYALDQEGKRYDWLQLILGYPANFILWLWPPLWGKEVIRWFNLRGGAEVCSSGWLACLRWGEKPFQDQCADRVREIYQDDPNFTGGVIVSSRFFEIYDTAVIPPCLCDLSENWRRE